MLALLGTLAGCRGPASDPSEPSPSPDGMGWCCPVSTYVSCHGTPAGGFVSDPEQCAFWVVQDGAPPVEHGTDEHGCAYIRLRGSCLAADVGRF